MLTLTVNIEGNQPGDLEIAIEEVARLIREGYLCGMNSNDTGKFNFNVAGEEETGEDDDSTFMTS